MPGDSPQQSAESFAEFKRSFSYGSRSDMSFKFLRSMPDDEAAEFLRRLLYRLGDAYDTGDIEPLIQLAYEAQIAGYRPPDTGDLRWTYDDRPFAPLAKPLADSRVGLITSSGHFVSDRDPRPFGVEEMTQQEAEDRISEFMKHAPELSSIPVDTPTDELMVRHGGYDVRSARRDCNVVFPRDRLVEAQAAGRINELPSSFFSFPGVASQGRLRGVIPDWIQLLQEQDTDVVLLVPV